MSSGAPLELESDLLWDAFWSIDGAEESDEEDECDDEAKDPISQEIRELIREKRRNLPKPKRTNNTCRRIWQNHKTRRDALSCIKILANKSLSHINIKLSKQYKWQNRIGPLHLQQSALYIKGFNTAFV